MAQKILIVEDEEKIARFVELELLHEGYEAEKVFDGRTGVDKALSGGFDLVVLDVMLPGLNGLEVLRRIRKESDVPVIMLTAREEETDKVFGLEAGADDYITKPFSMRELMARVKANIRRRDLDYGVRPKGELLQAGNLSIDPASFTVTKNGAPVELTQKEFDLLLYLIRERGRVFTREDLMQKVWNYDYFGDMRTVDVTVRRLREKIEDDPASPRYILTRRGVGYYYSTL